MATVRMRQKLHVAELTEPGDFCFESRGKVIMACPVCALVFYCPHDVVARDPVTLSPSIVGPERDRNPAEQVQGPCSHHFWVKEGFAVETTARQAPASGEK